MINLKYFFHVDSLALLMMSLVGFINLTIGSFSCRYLAGDSKQKRFFSYLLCLTLSLFLMVNADHLILFFISWGISNFFLVRLMLHKKEWSAAKASSNLALKNFIVGLIFIAIGFIILYITTGQASIQMILKSNIATPWLSFSSFFIFLGAMTQSALWPFHKWLTSSLNSPTPVSALMHAGLINGGGFLLVRFAPLYLQQPIMLHFIFIVGIFTALLGTLWKLMQYDVKRMLACSTMGQMGFMMAQCGLGLFGAAFAHLIWHGLFKAYLFLSSDSVAQQERLELNYPPCLKDFFYALIYGILSAYIFCIITGKSFLTSDTNLFLIILIILTGAQFVLPLLENKQPFKFFASACAALLIGSVYGLNIQLIYTMINPLNINQPQQFTVIYALGLILLICAWMLMLFGKLLFPSKQSDFRLKWYVRMLNLSQPDKSTITTHRNDYVYKGADNE